MNAMDSERFLSPEETDLLLNLTISAESFWDVIVASANIIYQNDVRELFRDDERVRVYEYRNGCDALVAVTRSIPDLLIIDESGISDVKCRDLISCIRTDDRLRHIRILCRLSADRGDTIPDWGADDYLPPNGGLDKIYISRKMHTQLYTSEPHVEGSNPDPHERFWPRTKLRIKAAITFADPARPGKMNHGEAVIENISLGGALLSNIRSDPGPVPCGSVVITLHFEHSVLNNLSAEASVVHREPDGRTGVKFLSLSREDRLRITDLFME